MNLANCELSWWTVTNGPDMGGPWTAGGGLEPGRAARHGLPDHVDVPDSPDSPMSLHRLRLVHDSDDSGRDESPMILHQPTTAAGVADGASLRPL